MAIVAKALDCLVPTSSKLSGRSNVTNVALGQANLFAETVLTKFTDDPCSFFFMGHGDVVTNYLSSVKTNECHFRTPKPGRILRDMNLRDKPFGDIAERIRWHRALEGLTQKEYAARLGQKRAALNNWESGDYRLSLDGALAMRETYGLSLDFMFAGNDDALPMTLRKAWRERS